MLDRDLRRKIATLCSTLVSERLSLFNICKYEGKQEKPTILFRRFFPHQFSSIPIFCVELILCGIESENTRMFSYIKYSNFTSLCEIESIKLK